MEYIAHSKNNSGEFHNLKEHLMGVAKIMEGL